MKARLRTQGGVATLAKAYSLVKPELRVEGVDEIVRRQVATIETTAHEKRLTLRF